MNENRKQIEFEQRRITDLVVQEFKQYYLTGGTALAFYFGHRYSEDLDFFSQEYKREDPGKIMDFVKQKTGFEYRLETEVNKPDVFCLQIYYIQILPDHSMKIDFVHDYTENLEPILKGIHSKNDIYYRKVTTAVGTQAREGTTGKIIPVGGRQTAKDLFDIYYLSCQYIPLCDFFFEYFGYNRIERLNAWYKDYSRTDLKLELLDLVPGVDVNEVLGHLDEQILQKIPDKVLES